MEELHKLKQARIHNHYVKVNRKIHLYLQFSFVHRSLLIDHCIKS